MKKRSPAFWLSIAIWSSTFARAEIIVAGDTGAAHLCIGQLGPLRSSHIIQINIVSQIGPDGNVLKVDPRGGIETKGPEIGLTPGEIEQARKTTGYVVCPEGEASAALVGDGSEIVTNAHVFIDEQNKFRRHCFFRNQELPVPKVMPLNFTKGSFKLMSEKPYDDGPNDLAFVKLKNRLPDVRPFDTDPSGDPVYEGQLLIQISAMQLRMEQKVDPNEPVVQSCVVEKVHAETAEHGTVFLSDCSSTKGASGSITLVRNRQGKLIIKGIIAAGGKPDKDYMPYSISDKSYAIHLGLDGATLDKLRKFESQ